MRLGQGHPKKTSIWAWAMFVGAVSVILPGASIVGAQEVADYTKPPAKPSETANDSRTAEPSAAPIESAQSEVGGSLEKLIAFGDSEAEARSLISSFLPQYLLHTSPKYGSYHHERYKPITVIGPMTSGGPASAIDPPTDYEVMHALRIMRRESGRPELKEIHSKGVRIVKEKIADFVDPWRNYPLMIGVAQVHHAHYRCTVYFPQGTIDGLPIPYNADDVDPIEVVYIDHNHLHKPRPPEANPVPILRRVDRPRQPRDGEAL